MTRTSAVTEQEIELARELEFPGDLDWDAKYRIREHQQRGKVRHLDIGWKYGLEHQYAGIEDILTGEAEPYIHDSLDHVPVAYSFEITMRDGHVTVLATMHPALLGHRGDQHAIGEEVITQAEMRVEFASARTDELVRAAILHNTVPPALQDPEDQENLLTNEGTLPDNLDWDVKYTVLVDPDEANLTGDWLGALKDGGDDLRDILEGAHTCATEYYGTLQVFSFDFSVNDRNLPVAHGSAHPAKDTGFELEPNLDHTIAAAEIVMEPKSQRTAAALVQYIRANHA